MATKPRRKHPQIDVSTDRLYLDTDNSRLPTDVREKGEAELLKNSLQRIQLK